MYFERLLKRMRIIKIQKIKKKNDKLSYSVARLKKTSKSKQNIKKKRFNTNSLLLFNYIDY